MPFSITLIYKNSWKIFELHRSLCKYSNTFVISIFPHYENVVYPSKSSTRDILGKMYILVMETIFLLSFSFFFSLFFIYIPTGDEGRRLHRKWNTKNKVHEGLISFRRKYGLINVELILKKKNEEEFFRYAKYSISRTWMIFLLLVNVKGIAVSPFDTMPIVGENVVE